MANITSSSASRPAITHGYGTRSVAAQELETSAFKQTTPQQEHAELHERLSTSRPGHEECCKGRKPKLSIKIRGWAAREDSPLETSRAGHEVCCKGKKPKLVLNLNGARTGEDRVLRASSERGEGRVEKRGQPKLTLKLRGVRAAMEELKASKAKFEEEREEIEVVKTSSVGKKRTVSIKKEE